MILDLMLNRCYDWRDGVHPARYETAMDLFWDKCIENDIFVFNKINMPDIRWFYGWRGWPIIYGDSIMIHHLFNDDYSMAHCNELESFGGEGSYFVDDIIAKSGEVVIDAGSYIGDFAAAAAVLGAKVYAFEPSIACLPILQDVATMNGFTVIEEGLGANVVENVPFAIVPKVANIDTLLVNTLEAGSFNLTTCKLNTIDNFSKSNDIHVDFIKSDIEGYERYMLLGAQEVLKKQEPDLAIRIYHNNWEDKTVIPKLIKDINPDYKIKYGIHQLTAYATTKRGI